MVLTLLLLSCLFAFPSDAKVTIISDSGREAEIEMKDELVAIVYGDKKSIYCSLSHDNGEAFSSPVHVGKLDGLLLGWRSGPQVAITKNYVTVLMTQRSDRDIYAWRSDHKGKKWEGPFKVTDAKRASLEGLSSVTSIGKDSLFSVWVDMRNAPRSTVRGSISHDGGKTWSSSRPVYESPSGQICACCQPTALYDRNKKLYVMWRNYIDGNRDMYLSVSDNEGETFSKAGKLGKGTWRLGACPTDGGGMAVDSEGNLTTIWRRKDVLYMSSLEGEEDRFRNGEQGRVAFGPGGLYITWQNKNSIYVLYPESSRPVKVAAGVHPAIASSPDGPVIIAWESVDEGGGIEAAILKGGESGVLE